MKYVYIIESLSKADCFYSGITQDIESRLEVHNSGSVPHTSKFRPWKLKSYVAFADETQAHLFEKYLKSGSGRAFAKKRL
jgi:predicted GIY-YIG superfamily endonuclease